MRKLLFALLFLLLALFLGHWIQKDPGYVLLMYHHVSVETTLWFAVVGLTLFFTALYFLIRLYRNAILFPSRLSRWGRRRQHKRSKSLTNQGLCDLAEGYWKNAEKTLVKAAKVESAPLINYLAAAQAAHAQGAYARRDEYLRLAHHSTEDTEIAVGLTQASLQIGSRQWEQALATLKHIKKSAPHHPHILKLLKRVYLELKDWKPLKDLLPELRPHRNIDTKKLDALEERVSLALLLDTIKSSTSANTLMSYWKTLGRRQRAHADFAAPMAKHLLTQHEAALAEDILVYALKKQWAPELMCLYGKLDKGDVVTHLQQIESWLRDHSNEPSALLAAGALSLKAGFSGKAKDYADKCLMIAPSVEAYQLLGQVFEATGDKEKALNTYREALALRNSK